MASNTTTKPGLTVTADQVALEAGVSRWTVNRAFRQDASISEKSRKKVMAAAEKLGYAPDLLAASMRSDRSNLVAVVVDDFANPYKLVMMERLTSILRLNGWDTILINTLGETDTSAALLSASQRRVDAAVLIGIRFDEKVLETALGAQRVRKLIVFARYSQNPNTISICCDDVAAMARIAEYVLDKDFQRPLFLAGPQTESCHLMRQQTFVRHWQDARGFEPDSTWVPAYDPELAYERLVEHLESLDRADFPDIVVCENDALAFGAIDAIRHHFGLRVPEDIAVTGFDDGPQANNPNYQLTTYHQPITAMAEALVDVLKGDEDSPDLSKFTGDLIQRRSA